MLGIQEYKIGSTTKHVNNCCIMTSYILLLALAFLCIWQLNRFFSLYYSYSANYWSAFGLPIEITHMHYEPIKTILWIPIMLRTSTKLVSQCTLKKDGIATTKNTNPLSLSFHFYQGRSGDCVEVVANAYIELTVRQKPIFFAQPLTATRSSSITPLNL